MAVFNSSKIFSTPVKDVSAIVDAVKKHFETDGYLVNIENSAFGSFVSLTKGGIFKTVLGMKTSLNIDIRTIPDGLAVDAKVGIFGQQAIPALITWFVAWPVILTQITGLVQQSKLDDEALQVIEVAIRSQERNSGASDQGGACFCVACGAALQENSMFCHACGAKQ
ncbi:MAG: zinc ribbon domain-containing protein [Clostridia bacterium]|nr:zinc ribbon domain-containing protein [Clostridia bacterium]